MIIRKIRTSKVTKVISSYLALQLIITIVQPNQLWALTSGPSQPEFNSFTPISTSDMVNLSSGNFNYNIPIMDVGGYPLNLAYDSGITMDQEASWTGLGWNLNVGQINRDVRGIPDDFKGDEMMYENNMKDNVTVGVYAGFDAQVFGIETPDEVKKEAGDVNLSVGVDLKYNNYHGISFTPSFGLAFDLSESVSVGMDVQQSATEGTTISPKVSAKAMSNELFDGAVNGQLSAGLSFNSNAGLSALTLSGGVSATSNASEQEEKKRGVRITNTDKGYFGGSGSVSFANATFTPRKRTAFRDYTGTLAVSVGADIWGVDGELEVSAMGAVQKIKDKVKPEKAYGYEFTGHAGSNDILDYNREKDNIISKSTLALPTAAYTYDLYSVNAQGASGMFRPFRSQVGEIHDITVEDKSASFSLGVEIEAASAFHTGLNFTAAPSVSKTGVWNTKALKHFKQSREDVKETDEKLNYEPVYFKYIGEPRVDKDQKLFEDLGGYNPIALEILGSKSSFNKQADNKFRVKEYQNLTPTYQSLVGFDTKFKRQNRDIRNQSIQKISKREVGKLYTKSYIEKRVNDNAKDHHTAEMRVLNADGSTYVFGETAYNKTKKEVTFTTDSNNYNCADGLVTYSTNESTPNNKSGIDNFFSRTTTPEYAHTYLISAVLSSDYEDIGGDGPTDDDLGAYTRFEYKQAEEDYKWRVPYSKASFDPGLNTNKADQKANYIYGEKEIKYLEKIVTKTHVAILKLSERKDGRGVSGENGGGSSSVAKMYKIDEINLYSKPEAEKAKILDDDPGNDQPINAIKTAHFVYDYSQCQGIENNLGGSLTENELNNEGGKLTLRQVYFTYRDSNMGKYTPYTFNYDGLNPEYNLKSYDIWGNYKPNSDSGCNTQDPITAPEFPFVQQEDKALQDLRTSAWTLTSIDLPSGGRIELEYESDDYQYVQDRPTMQMFMVAGAGTTATTNDPENNQKLYKINGDNEAKYLYVKLPDETDTNFNFKEKYLKGIDEKPIYFRFLLNMTKSGAVSDASSNYDYVTGYFESDEEVTKFQANNAVYAAIPMKTTDMEGGVSGNNPVNPISKAGWYFGRQYLNGQVFGLNADYRTENVASIAKKVLSSFAAIKDIFTGPNGKLRSNEFLCAQRFIPEKSWIRLSTPKSYKLGGGVRVKKLVMKDQWNKMLDQNIPDTNKRYNKEYGQTYTYTLNDGSSSGVAAYEPNMSKENPFVEPFYNKGERLIAPKEISYVEKSFGESFFPAPTVTYSKVTVSNLERDGITRHATGKVVSEFYTSYDFPTKVDYTAIDDPDNFASNQNQFLQNFIKSAVGFPMHIKNEITLSQGFKIHTNDMNGKMRSQKVYAEGQEEPISSVDYFYSTSADDKTILNNYLPVIDKGGNVNYDRQIGVDYDVVTDFRESYSKSSTIGLKGNVVVMMIGIFPVVVPSSFFTNTNIENVAHTTITTKVIHTTAVLKEKIATDLGAKVSTINEAWDAETGQVILTRTINEFDDEYYNFSFPAYWAYQNMGQASKNIGITGTLQNNGDYYTMTNANQYFTLGDEVLVHYGNNQYEKLWVIDFNSSGSGVLLMDKAGNVINRTEGRAINEPLNFKIIRSGYRNQQMANMASLTMMKNPIKDSQGNNMNAINTSTFIQTENGSISDNLKIVNASAVEYDEFWNCQCESGLEYLPYTSEFLDELEDIAFEDYGFNPYVYNVNGEWRAKKSYAYLTERTNVIEGGSTKANTRREGYYKEFTPYYALTEDDTWEKAGNANDSWTFASEVTQYSPYGMEIENKDALNRYSSAQYGYNFTLPTAVTSNSKYRYMGADNFEDYKFSGSLEGHFNFKEPVDADGDEGIRLSETYSHTGRTSLLVPKTESAQIIKQLVGEPPEVLDFDGDGINDDADYCPFIYSSNSDYDGDGIGDECDDDAIPTVSEKSITPQERWWIKTSTFTIEGNPNSTVEYSIEILERGRTGLKMFLNEEELSTVADIITGEITLDVTGRAYVVFRVQANKDKKKNRVMAQFFLKNKLSGHQIVSTVTRICPRAFKISTSGKGDTGEPKWQCDQ